MKYLGLVLIIAGIIALFISLAGIIFQLYTLQMGYAS